MSDKPSQRITRIGSNLYRCEGLKTVSYYVRFQRQGNHQYKCFSSMGTGGSDLALKEAIQYRDMIHEKIPRKKRRGAPVTTLRSDNTSGVTGVSHFLIAGRYPCFRAMWRENGKNRTKNYSYKLGDEAEKIKAFEKAVQYRAKMIHKHYQG